MLGVASSFMKTPDRAVELYRQGLDLMDAATDLNGFTAARAVMINGVLALLEAAHQGWCLSQAFGKRDRSADRSALTGV